jgi:putative heme degradation protein
VVPGCNLKDGLVQLLNPDMFLKVFPNPAHYDVYIESTDAKTNLQSIIVYDINGNLLNQQLALHQGHHT